MSCKHTNAIAWMFDVVSSVVASVICSLARTFNAILFYLCPCAVKQKNLRNYSLAVCFPFHFVSSLSLSLFLPFAHSSIELIHDLTTVNSNSEQIPYALHRWQGTDFSNQLALHTVLHESSNNWQIKSRAKSDRIWCAMRVSRIICHLFVSISNECRLKVCLMKNRCVFPYFFSIWDSQENWFN